jgi:hypothetical protein
MLPLMGLLVIVTLHWGQFLALFGVGVERPLLEFRVKQPPLPWLYVTVILVLVFLFEVLPYLEELVRGLRGRDMAHALALRLVPAQVPGTRDEVEKERLP